VWVVYTGVETGVGVVHVDGTRVLNRAPGPGAGQNHSGES
jgi:hypothetical protein